MGHAKKPFIFRAVASAFVVLACLHWPLWARADAIFPNNGNAEAFDIHLVLTRINPFRSYDSDPWGEPSENNLTDTLVWRSANPIGPGQNFTLLDLVLTDDFRLGTNLILDAFWTDRNGNELYKVFNPFGDRPLRLFDPRFDPEVIAAPISLSMMAPGLALLAFMGWRRHRC